MTDSRVTLHMVSSLDFIIAKPDGTVSWMESTDQYEKGSPYPDFEAFMKGIDCYVMGSRTYEHALDLGWVYGDVPTFVLTRRHLEDDRESVDFCSGDLQVLVNERLKPRYPNIWVVGGAVLATEFLRLKLADEIVISIMPILLGKGTRFVDLVGQEQRLHLKDSTAYQDGMVELTYAVK